MSKKKKVKHEEFHFQVTLDLGLTSKLTKKETETLVTEMELILSGLAHEATLRMLVKTKYGGLGKLVSHETRVRHFSESEFDGG